MGKRKRNKFEFGTDFQELILKYTVTDNRGFKALQLYEDTYFDLIHHSVIAYALKKYYKKYKNVPEEPYLREFLRVLYHTDVRALRDLTPEDRNLISNTINQIYSGKVVEPERIIDKVVKFARYVAFKDEMENVDINNFDSYEASLDKLRKATSIGNELQENYGTFLIRGMKDRAHKRDSISAIHPTPWWQLNGLLNSGGTETGNVMVLLGKQKDFKTGGLINLARGYMKLKKKIFYVDLENGEVAITTRTEQSVSNNDQETIRSGEWDERLLKLFRKYNRIGAEVGIKRFSSLTTTCADIQNWLDKVKRDFEIVFDVGIIDYGVLLGCMSGKSTDFDRISDAFLDIKNLAEHNKLDAIWTAAHVDRKGVVRRKSIYESTDIAKCIDIPRHVDAVFGLQQNEEEEEGNVCRIEIVDQRNGMSNGKMLFWIDKKNQRITEFTKKEIKAYWKQVNDEDETYSEKKQRKNKDL